MNDTAYLATPPQAADETTMPKNEPQVTYRFGDGVAMPADISPLAVGNKAANLMRMAEAGLPVPPGFVITTRVCRDYFDRGGSLPEDLPAWLSRDIEYLERVTD